MTRTRPAIESRFVVGMDTLTATAGALSGAYLGEGVLNEALLSKLEDGAKGRTYIRNVPVRQHAARAAQGTRTSR